MKMHKWVGFLFVLCLVFTFTGMAAADEWTSDYNSSDMSPCMKTPGMMGTGMNHPMMGKSDGMMGMPPMMNRWEDLQSKLELSEEQAEKFRKIYADYRKEMMKRRVEIEIAEMDLMELLKSKDASDKAIEEISNRIQSAWSSLNTYRVKALLKTRSFLSDKQYQELLHFLMDWRGSRMGGWGYGWH